LSKKKVFAIRISQQDRVLYEAAAEREGLGIQGWIRIALTNQALETLSNTESEAERPLGK